MSPLKSQDFQTTKKLILAETMTNKPADRSELTTDRQHTNKREMSAQRFWFFHQFFASLCPFIGGRWVDMWGSTAKLQPSSLSFSLKQKTKIIQLHLGIDVIYRQTFDFICEASFSLWIYHSVAEFRRRSEWTNRESSVNSGSKDRPVCHLQYVAIQRSALVRKRIMWSRHIPFTTGQT